MKRNKFLTFMVSFSVFVTVMAAYVRPVAAYDVTCTTTGCITTALTHGDTVINITLDDHIDFEDITGGSGFVIPAGKDVTIDLNGKTISGYRDTATSTQIILNNGNLTLKDSQPRASWGSIEMSSNAMGVGHDTGSYNISNNQGTVTIESGRYINLGGADVPYVINNMPGGSSTEPAVVNIYDGYFESTGSSVFRMYTWYSPVDNIVNIYDGEFYGWGSVGWIQTGNNNPASTGKFELNVYDGDFHGGNTGVFYVSYHYRADANYPDVSINIEDGNFYSRIQSGYTGTRFQSTIGYMMSYFVAGDNPVGHAANIAPKLTVKGGRFDHETTLKNIDHTMYSPNGAVEFDTANFNITAGHFTWDPVDYLKDTTLPAAKYTPADSYIWYHVSNSYISEGLALAGDDDDTLGLDRFEIIRNTFRVNTTVPGNLVKSDVEFFVNSGASMEILSGGTLTNEGRITNDGITRIDGGTLMNKTIIVNNDEFYHLGGSVSGVPGAIISHGPLAKTDASASATVFYNDLYDGTSIPLTGTDVAEFFYEYISDNHWAMFVMDVQNGEIAVAPHNGRRDGVSSSDCEYHSSSIITVTASPTPSGKVFSHWNVISPDPLKDTRINDIYSETAVYEMGMYGVRLEAVYIDRGPGPNTGDYSTIVLPVVMMTLMAMVAVVSLKLLKKD